MFSIYQEPNMNTYSHGDQMRSRAATRHVTHRGAVIVACALVAGVAGLARAADPVPHPLWTGAPVAEQSVRISVNDLDLTSAVDIQTAVARLTNAARRACEYTTRGGDYVVGRAEIYFACVDQAMTAATGRLQQLRRVALMRSGHQTPDIARSTVASSALGSPVSQ
jgi:UrcA family protein